MSSIRFERIAMAVDFHHLIEGIQGRIATNNNSVTLNHKDNGSMHNESDRVRVLAVVMARLG